MHWNKADKELAPMKKREGEFQMVVFFASAPNVACS